MSNFETIVRPFVVGIVTPPDSVPIASYVTVKNVIINPGNGGGAKTMSGSFNKTVTFYMIKKPAEESKK